MRKWLAVVTIGVALMTGLMLKFLAKTVRPDRLVCVDLVRLRVY